MNPQYDEGRQARKEDRHKNACPYGHSTHHKDLDTGLMIGTSELAKRHWWLAGWHDADMEAA